MNKNIKSIANEIEKLIEKYCIKYLNNDYYELSKKMIRLLSNYIESPLLRGKSNIWACGIIYSIGFVNFLFDKGTEPYVSCDELCKEFKVKKSTAYNKSKLIRDNFDMIQFDPEWTISNLIDENPLIWMVEINGFVMDIRSASRELQEMAYKEGIIPYIPTDKKTKNIFEENKIININKEEIEKQKSHIKKKKIIEEDPSQLLLDF